MYELIYSKLSNPEGYDFVNFSFILSIIIRCVLEHATSHKKIFLLVDSFFLKISKRLQPMVDHVQQNTFAITSLTHKSANRAYHI